MSKQARTLRLEQVGQTWSVQAFFWGEYLPSKSVRKGIMQLKMPSEFLRSPE